MAFQTVDLYSSGITIGMMENSPEREEGENRAPRCDSARSDPTTRAPPAPL